MHLNKRTMFLSLLAIILIGAGMLLLKSQRQIPIQRVTVAVNLPLSGPISSFMAPYPDALVLGLEDGFRNAGMPAGSFRTDIQDNAGKPAQAVSVVQQQILRGFNVYISGSSEMSSAILPEVDARAVPHFLIAFDAYMTSKGPNRLRILPHYKLEGPKWLEYVQLRQAKRVALLTLNNAAIEEEFTALVEPGLRNRSVKYMRERFEWTGSDYRVLAEKVKRYKPDLILVSGYSVHLYPIISSLRSLEMVKEENVLAGMDFDDLLYNGTPKMELAGVAFIAPLFEVSSVNERVKTWTKRFELRFHKRATYVAAYGYDTGTLIATASARTSEPTKADLLAALPFEGIAGRIALDNVGDLTSTLVLAKLNQSFAPVVLNP